MRHAKQVADDFDRNGGRIVGYQVTAAFGFHVVQQAVHQRHQAALHVGNSATRKRAHDELAHTRVQRRLFGAMARTYIYST